MKCFATDLHTHILPSVDDGASNVDIAIEMLCLQKQRGIERVALTPHFYPHRESMESFLKRRQESYGLLQNYWTSDSMPQISLGAEVRYSPELLQLDLQQLTLGPREYLLLELPNVGVAPLLDRVIDKMLSQNIKPIFAHIERCSMFRNDPSLLQNYIEEGVLAQITLDALIGSGDSFAVACLRNGLAHIVASDVHSPMDCVNRKSVKNHLDLVQWADSFAEAVWNSTPLPAFSVSSIKKGFFGYR